MGQAVLRDRAPIRSARASSNVHSQHRKTGDAELLWVDHA
jgi:hypothetical protein